MPSCIRAMNIKSNRTIATSNQGATEQDNEFASENGLNDVKSQDCYSTIVLTVKRSSTGL